MPLDAKRFPAMPPERRRSLEVVAEAVDGPGDQVTFRPLIAPCVECGSHAMLVGIPELPPADKELVDGALKRLVNSVCKAGVKVYPISGGPAPSSWKCNDCSYENIVGVVDPSALERHFGD